MDQDQLELAERRFAENVEARVRRRLLWPMIVVVAVVGFFGYDLVNDLRTAAIGAASEAARAEVQPAVENANLSAAKAAESAQEARDQAASSRQMLGFIEDWMKERRNTLSELEDDVALRSAKVEERADDLRSHLEGLGSRIEETEKEIEAQSARAAGVYAGAGNLAELALQVTSLAEELKEVDRQVDQVNQAVASIDQEYAPELRDVPSKILSIAEATERIGGLREDASTTEKKVFLHFSSAAREMIQRLSRRLSEEGWTIPEAQRVEEVPKTPQVRYYFESDAQAARQVASVTTSWLSSNGLGDEVLVRDFTNYAGTKPRPGVLELWVDPHI